MTDKGIKVSSKDQKGGITAGVIHFEIADKDKKRRIYYIAAVATVIMLILGITAVQGNFF